MEYTYCKFCDPPRRFDGFTQNQADYILKQHILSKHPDKIKVVE